MNLLLTLKNKRLKFSNFIFQSSLIENFEVMLVCMQGNDGWREKRQKRKTVIEKYLFDRNIDVKRNTTNIFITDNNTAFSKKKKNDHSYSSNLFQYNSIIYFIIIFYFIIRTGLKIGFLSESLTKRKYVFFNSMIFKKTLQSHKKRFSITIIV